MDGVLSKVDFCVFSLYTLISASVSGDMRQVSSSSSSEDNLHGMRFSGSGDTTSDTDKRDILDLLKLSYVVVRTGIGTGQIMVKHITVI